MAKWTQAAREAYHKEHPENFAGPDMSFPVKDGSDVADAWGLAGHADNPDAVRAKIKSIAKRLGLTSSLPDTAKEDDNKERSMGADHTPEALTRATSANHEPMTGKHSDPHPSMGDQGDDETHEHEHEHDGDNDHGHDHGERSTSGIIQVSDRLAMYAPLTRIDSTKWEVKGQATAEIPDSYKTIFGYYPDAWLKWRGNIREQHDSKKAVGKALEVVPLEHERAIDVHLKVSRGAPDTWAKVEDNVLTGLSASVIPDPEFGNDPAKWPKKEYNGKMYPYLPRYTVAELSLVDNPACPGCNIQIVRADGFVTDVLDCSEENTSIPSGSLSSSSLSRAGARVSADTRSAMHGGIGHTIRAAVKQMQNCGCDDCNAAMKLIDPDEDGDVDLGGYDDPDNDWQSLYGGSGDMDRAVIAAIERVLPGAIERALAPAYARLQGIAGALSRSNQTQFSEEILTGAITRAVEVASAASLSEVHADLSAVKETVARIEATPVPGAPVMNASVLPRPVEKRLATDPYQAPQRSGSAVYDAIQRLSEAGMLDTPEKQADAMAAGLMAQRAGR